MFYLRSCQAQVLHQIAPMGSLTITLDIMSNQKPSAQDTSVSNYTDNIEATFMLAIPCDNMSCQRSYFIQHHINSSYDISSKASLNTISSAVQIPTQFQLCKLKHIIYRLIQHHKLLHTTMKKHSTSSRVNPT